MICLRSYHSVAQVAHWCDRCCQPIYPGEMYEGVVQVLPNQEHRLIVWKTHINPSCDFPEDPDEELYRRDGEGIASLLLQNMYTPGEDDHFRLGLMVDKITCRC